VSTALLAPQPEFVYRPMRVREPFAYAEAQRYPLADIAADLGAELFTDSFSSLDASERLVHTEGGAKLGYDALVLALGARLRAPFAHAMTIDDAKIDEQLHGLIQDVEQGYARSIAFVIPAPMPWPLPAYELALMTARRAYDMNQEVEVTVITPEERPLAVFGLGVSDAVAALLEENRITTITSAYCEVPKPGELSIWPLARELHADRVVALPQLIGPATPGVPGDGMSGFIPIDEHCKVPHLDAVYAAGDATAFPVKFGGIAAQQADAAAEAIAAGAGAPVDPAPFEPVLRGILLGGEKPLYLTAQITGGHGTASEVSEQASWSPPTKIVARYLAPYLEERDERAGRAA
jgi:sulfide:quinone oxidoreductase